jgi:hypothetical protein
LVIFLCMARRSGINRRPKQRAIGRWIFILFISLYTERLDELLSKPTLGHLPAGEMVNDFPIMAMRACFLLLTGAICVNSDHSDQS